MRGSADFKANVVLVGFMGTGKSAVGRALASRLRRRFVDTDAWIQAEAQLSIPRIFEQLGEAAFRDLETRAAEAFSLPRKQVVSTGGGILGREENVRLLRAGGVLVCLRARPEVVLNRTAPWENRPMLRSAEDPEQAVRDLLAERGPEYALADFAVDTSDLSVPQVVDEICARLTSLYPGMNTGS